MQPYVILQRPGKAFLSLFIMMLLFVVEYCDGLDEQCNGACYGPISKVKVFNEGSNGLVHVRERTVLANSSNNGFLYKISKGASFYYFDPNANRFICWNKNHNNLVARKYKKSENMRLCEFKDAVSENKKRNTTHVQLQFASNSKIKMKFNRRGRFSTRKALHNCKKRRQQQLVARGLTQTILRHHAHHACEFSDFLVMSECECPEVFQKFCCSELRDMHELRDMCRDWRPRCDNNDTFYY